MGVDLVFMVQNRLAFTYLSLSWLVRTLDVESVNKIILLDDRSTDGTSKYLQHMASFVLDPLVPTDYVKSACDTMSGAFAQFLERSSADIVCKIDNDICITESGWLPRLMDVMERSPELCCLGITNPVMEQVLELQVTSQSVMRGYIPTKHIGGIGLFRRDMFDIDALRICKKDGRERGYSGIQSAQKEDERIKGWCVPFLKTELLDRPSHKMWGRADLLKHINDQYRLHGYGKRNEQRYLREK